MAKRRHFVEVGQQFGRLTVTNPDVRTVPRPGRLNGDHAALCRCECGKMVAVEIYLLVRGNNRSCGCLQRDRATEWGRSSANRKSSEALDRLREGPRTHGMRYHPLYGTWAMMLTRCEDPRHKEYKNYGARGVSVCAEWHDVSAFITWIEANIGPRPVDCYENGWPKFTLDRIDNDRGYVPGNVRWATQSQQVANKRKQGTA